MTSNTRPTAPLAERMRPETIEEFAGQDELVGPSSFLRGAITEDRVPSMILWGPPGSGKTTLARIIARATHAEFVALSATSSGLKELREVLARAEEGSRLGVKTILFIDEIHRWNKAQQDALLPFVERGVITLIGATTENPSFEVNSALLSRARVFVLHRLSADALATILAHALEDSVRGIGGRGISMPRDAVTFLANQANGDARMALNTLEAATHFSPSHGEGELEGVGQYEVSIDHLKTILQKSHLLYDKNGEEHYNVISALHKSMRGGDANAAVYWLARMLEGGEDPLYVARRLVRFASEDIGLANATALILANTVFDACHKLGMPECAVHLAHLVIYLAKSQKSIAAYEAYARAKHDVEAHGAIPVPLHLRNAPTDLMKDLGYGKGYQYTPREDSHAQTYLPPELEGRQYVKEGSIEHHAIRASGPR
ncbi:replication-associated recombination protein A [Candidatus Uhrbacteria bacterium]|nr:replication-associated recombination protein A [Candidatus Uhrbacteria bacterium]